MKILPTLADTRIFSGMNEQEIDAALAALDAGRKRFAKGAYLLRAGDPVRSLGLLLSGSALVLQEDFWGNRNLLAPLGPGQCFGEVFACVPGAVSSVSVEAAEETEVLFLKIDRLLRGDLPTSAQQSRILQNLLLDMAGKTLLLNGKVTHLSQRSTRARLLSYLSEQARRSGSAEFDIPFSRQQLADYLSVERSGLSAELGKLQKEGLLTFRKNHFHLLVREG